MTISFSCSGEYEFRVVGGERDGLLLNRSKNLITDIGLDMLIGNRSLSYSYQNPFVNCYVGAGSTAPTATDVQLQGPNIASTSTIQAKVPAAGDVTATQDAPNSKYYYELQYTYRFPVLVGGNVNYAEVGVGDTSTSLFSRAQIVGPDTMPTTITIKAGEQLDVTYKLRVNAPAKHDNSTSGGVLADRQCGSGSVAINGVTYNYNVYLYKFLPTSHGINTTWVGQLAGMSANAQWYLSADQNLTYPPPPAGPAYALRTASGAKMAAGKRRITVKMGLNDAINGVARVWVKPDSYPMAEFCFVFDKVIPKDANSTLEFDLDFEIVRA